MVLELATRDGQRFLVRPLFRLPRVFHLGWAERLVSGVAPLAFLTVPDGRTIVALKVS